MQSMKLESLFYINFNHSEYKNRDGAVFQTVILIPASQTDS